MKFCGKFKGCVRETVVSERGVAECEYKGEVKIQNVNCSQQTAFLIDIKDQTGHTQNLAYLENAKKPILRSPTSSLDGITSTYYDGKTLIHQVSSVKTDCKGNKEWTVKFYRLKPC